MATTQAITPENQVNAEPEVTQTTYIKHLATLATSLLKDIVPSLLNAVSLVILSGYLVINGYIHKYSQLSLYNVSLSQYIAAGLNFFMRVFSYPLLAVGIIALFAVVSLVIYVVAQEARLGIVKRRFSSQREIKQRKFAAEIKKATNQIEIDQALRNAGNELAQEYEQTETIVNQVLTVTNRFFKWYSRAQKPIALLLIIIYALITVVGSPVYGAFSYGEVDRYLGGGKPTDIVIVFKEGSRSPGWSFPIDAITGCSTKVKLLLQLTDGILVWDEANKMSAEIKNDAILGIVDYSGIATQNIPSSTPIAGTTPTP